MMEDIDYKALFEQVQHENENIRIRYFKLKNEEMSFFERLKDKWAEFVDDERFPVYLNIGIVLLTFIVAPVVSALFKFFTRRTPNVE